MSKAIVDWRRLPRKRRDHRPHDGPGERLREARIAKGMTQTELGARVDRSRSCILAIERGVLDPSEPVALALEDALELPGLFDLQPCPCSVPWCGERAVGGKFAKGHRGFTDEERRRGGHKNEGRKRPDRSAWLTAFLTQAWAEDRVSMLRVSAKGQLVQHGHTAMYGRYAHLFAAQQGKKVGPRPKLSESEEIEIRERRERGQSQQQIANTMGISRKQVRRAEQGG
jgi:DNA-binding XRE family transcriptional regulator